jgi:DNA-binding GntR family transcriptional regulator
MASTSGKIYLKEKVYKRVINDIMQGAINPGDYLTELSLCEKYDVSRTPVREALVRLSYEDFLTQFKKGGYIVRDISYKDLFELLDIRLVLEVHAVKLAVERISDGDLEILKKDTVFEDFEEWFECNKEFHLTIAKASGNTHLAEIIENLLDRTRRMYILDSTNLFPIPDENDHTDIFRAFKNKDRKKAAELVEKHILTSKNRIKDHIKSKLFDY